MSDLRIGCFGAFLMETLHAVAGNRGLLDKLDHFERFEGFMVMTVLGFTTAVMLLGRRTA